VRDHIRKLIFESLRISHKAPVFRFGRDLPARKRYIPEDIEINSLAGADNATVHRVYKDLTGAFGNQKLVSAIMSHIYHESKFYVNAFGDPESDRDKWKDKGIDVSKFDVFDPYRQRSRRYRDGIHRYVSFGLIQFQIGSGMGVSFLANGGIPTTASEETKVRHLINYNNQIEYIISYFRQKLGTDVQNLHNEAYWVERLMQSINSRAPASSIAERTETAISLAEELDQVTQEMSQEEIEQDDAKKIQQDLEEEPQEQGKTLIIGQDTFMDAEFGNAIASIFDQNNLEVIVAPGARKNGWLDSWITDPSISMAIAHPEITRIIVVVGLHPYNRRKHSKFLNALSSASYDKKIIMIGSFPPVEPTGTPHPWLLENMGGDDWQERQKYYRDGVNRALGNACAGRNVAFINPYKSTALMNRSSVDGIKISSNDAGTFIESIRAKLTSLNESKIRNLVRKKIFEALSVSHQSGIANIDSDSLESTSIQKKTLSAEEGDEKVALVGDSQMQGGIGKVLSQYFPNAIKVAKHSTHPGSFSYSGRFNKQFINAIRGASKVIFSLGGHPSTKSRDIESLIKLIQEHASQSVQIVWIGGPPATSPVPNVKNYTTENNWERKYYARKEKNANTIKPAVENLGYTFIDPYDYISYEECKNNPSTLITKDGIHATIKTGKRIVENFLSPSSSFLNELDASKLGSDSGKKSNVKRFYKDNKPTDYQIFHVIDKYIPADSYPEELKLTILKIEEDRDFIRLKLGMDNDKIFDIIFAAAIAISGKESSYAKGESYVGKFSKGKIEKLASDLLGRDTSLGPTQIRFSNLKNIKNKKAKDTLKSYGINNPNALMDYANALISTMAILYQYYKKAIKFGYDPNASGFATRSAFKSTGNAALDISLTAYNANGPKWINYYCGEGKKKTRCKTGTDCCDPKGQNKNYIPYVGKQGDNTHLYVSATGILYNRALKYIKASKSKANKSRSATSTSSSYNKRQRRLNKKLRMRR
jgi:Tat protein secretion system quality control protein TatD with DNase activity